MSELRGSGAASENENRHFSVDEALSEPPTERENTQTDAARVDGWGTEPPAAHPNKINNEAGQQAKRSPISAEEWIARHLAVAPRISDERWARIDAVFAMMEDQRRSEAVRSSRQEPE